MNVYPMELVLAEARKLQEQATALQAENAKLREERREYQATIDSLVDECTDHKAENAKLRELLSSYWKAVHCPVTPTVPRDYLAEMRELGIGVDA